MLRTAATAFAVAVIASLALATAPAHAKTKWLCLPSDRDNPCLGDQASTFVSATGNGATEKASPAKKPKFDCFYVYPTVSPQQTLNADLRIQAEQTAVARQHASRFTEQCAMYAPMYRQLTLAGIAKPLAEQRPGIKIALGDVRAAWREYLRKYNRGRGVVIIGHSQGAGLLKQMIRKDIDGKPVQKRLISALIIGGNFQVPEGKTVGGDLRHIPACTRASQTACVVAYSTFSQPPPQDALFGRFGGRQAGVFAGAKGDNLEILCNNPARLGGGAASVDTYFRTERFPGVLGQVSGDIPQAPTPWVHYDGAYRTECKNEDGASWLQVDFLARPDDARVHIQQTLGPAWGLHLADMNVVLGDLVALVKKQGAAYLEQ